MRRALAGGLLLLLSVSAPARAADIRVVKTAAEVYTEASDKAPNYVTNRLGRGAAVEVVQERPDGWLAIRPPAHSRSWINSRFLTEKFPGTNNWVVQTVGHEPMSVPVFPAPADPSGQGAAPRTQSRKLARGYQVSVTGNKRTDKDGTWFEIEAPDDEPRYIRADAVERSASPVLLQAGGGASPAANLQPSTAPSANVIPSSEQLRREAVDADLKNDHAKAIRLYDRIVSLYAATEPRLAQESKVRADYLRSTLEEHVTAVPAAAPVNLASRQATPTATTTANQGRADPYVRTYRGTLMHGYGQIDGQRTYILSFHQKAGGWMTHIVVVAEPGVNLEGFVNRDIALEGPVTYQGRAYVMHAARGRLVAQE